MEPTHKKNLKMETQAPTHKVGIFRMEGGTFEFILILTRYE